MIFLHPEFFLWMLPLVLVLFYFWQTQKSPEHPLFGEAILQRLRAPEVTMGLKGRNTLFLIASVLLIAAMAQPVIPQKEGITPKRGDILIVLNVSKKSLKAFEAMKSDAVRLIRGFEGERIGIIGYDERLYRIAPLSTDTAILVSLIEGLDPEVMRSSVSDTEQVNAFSSEAVKVILGDPDLRVNTPFSTLQKRIEQTKSSQRLRAHIPLFYYPLGGAMLLIGIALSSMSKRRSVPVAALVMAIGLQEPSLYAGIFDFRLLDEARTSYEQGAYERSAELFKEYQKMHDTPEIRYNRANALYMAHEYAQAKIWYQRVYSNDPLTIQRTRYNLVRTIEMLERQGVKREKERGQKQIKHDHAGLKRVKEEGTTTKTRLYPII